MHRLICRLPLPTRAISSTTFLHPPLYGSLSLPEVREWHTEHSRAHQLFVFAREDGSVHSVSWVEAARAMRAGENIIQDRLNDTRSMGGPGVIAILVGSCTYSDYLLYTV